MSYIEIGLDYADGNLETTSLPLGYKVRIEVPKTDMNLGEIWEDLMRPALLASGFQPESIDSEFPEP